MSKSTSQLVKSCQAAIVQIGQRAGNLQSSIDQAAILAQQAIQQGHDAAIAAKVLNACQGLKWQPALVEFFSDFTGHSFYQREGLFHAGKRGKDYAPVSPVGDVKPSAYESESVREAKAEKAAKARVKAEERAESKAQKEEAEKAERAKEANEKLDLQAAYARALARIQELEQLLAEIGTQQPQKKAA
jgi:hypothetical protein